MMKLQYSDAWYGLKLVSHMVYQAFYFTCNISETVDYDSEMLICHARDRKACGVVTVTGTYVGTQPWSKALAFVNETV